MISIGAAYRGPELRGSKIDRTVMAVSKALKELRGDSSRETPAVIAVFVIGGSLGEPDFNGLRYGQYSKKDRTIVVQIAILSDEVAGSDPLDLVVDSLHGANAMAFEFFRQKSLEFPLCEAETLLNSIQDLLQNE